MLPSLVEGGGGTIWLTLLIMWWIRLFVDVFVLESVLKDRTILVVCWRYQYRREAIGRYLVPVYQCSDCFDENIWNWTLLGYCSWWLKWLSGRD